MSGTGCDATEQPHLRGAAALDRGEDRRVPRAHAAAEGVPLLHRRRAAVLDLVEQALAAWGENPVSVCLLTTLTTHRIKRVITQ